VFDFDHEEVLEGAFAVYEPATGHRLDRYRIRSTMLRARRAFSLIATECRPMRNGVAARLLKTLPGFAAAWIVLSLNDALEPRPRRLSAVAHRALIEDGLVCLERTPGVRGRRLGFDLRPLIARYPELLAMVAAARCGAG
jgi:hypothetical protein